MIKNDASNMNSIVFSFALSSVICPVDSFKDYGASCICTTRASAKA